MRAFVSIILEVCRHGSGRCFLWCVLLLSSGCILFAQENAFFASASASASEGNVINLPGDDVRDEKSTTSAVVLSPAIKHLEETFQSKDYAGAVAEVRSLIAGLAEGSPDLDMAMFIEGVSLYYTGRHEEAQLPLNRHLVDFPLSSHARSAHYFAGSNLLKQSCWRAAGNVLDEFIHTHPESVLMAYALYDRATVHLALNEYQACFSQAERIEANFGDSALVDRAGLLKGEVLKRTGKMAQSEGAFIIAKNAAQRAGHVKVAAYALRKLIEVSGQQGRWTDSAAYYDTFFLNYSTSSQALTAAAAGLPTLSKLNRTMVGLNRLEDMIIAISKETIPRSLDAALRVHGRYFSEMHGPEELLKRYRDLSMLTRENEQLREALIVARLEVLETYFTGRDAEIDVFYDEIRCRFERENLSTFMVMKVARHVAEYDPGEGVLWLSELIERPGVQGKDEAIVALAQIRATSGDPGQMNLAKDGFQSFLREYGSPKLEETVIAELARVSEQLEDWECVRDCWRNYLSRPEWTMARGEALQAMTRIPELSKEPKIMSGEHQPGVEQRQAVAPILPNSRVSEIGGMLASRIESAKKLIRSGIKKEAMEILGQVVMDGGRIRKPDAHITSIIRRAGILRENLKFELQTY
jgi:tetratricopeptide (TPR) repeat protein